MSIIKYQFFNSTKILPIFEFPNNRGRSEQTFCLLGREIVPKIPVVVGGIERGGECGIAVEGCCLVVRTAGLTLVTAKDPTSGIKGLVVARLDGTIGDAEGCYYGTIWGNCARWAS